MQDMLKRIFAEPLIRERKEESDLYYENACVKSGKKRFAKRLIALTICIFFIAGSIFSVVSVFKHISHRHERIGSNMNCAICLHLTMVENLLKLLASVITGASLVFGCLFVVLSLLKPVVFYTDFSTLINQKIRFNN